MTCGISHPLTDMETGMKQTSTLKAALPGLLLLIPMAASAQVTVDCSAGGVLQTAINNAQPGVTILVLGVCNENIRVNDEKARITLDGLGAATIHGSNPAANTILVAGRNITIRGFTVSGGRNGIAVLRGGMGLIESNTIQGASENGINVAQHSFAGIVNNTVRDNQAAGIRMLDGSSARIGFVDLAQPARGNVIQRNGAAGVLVQGSSGASLAANDITENLGSGVSVEGASHADLAGNQINGNGADAVAVTQNSFVQLGDLAGLLNPPNETAVPNTGFGLSCSLNSSVDGQLGTLNGLRGVRKFDSSCSNTPRIW